MASRRRAEPESSPQQPLSLRRLLASDRAVQVMGAHDALGARLAEEAGFDAIWASGLEISASAGVPDANILTMTEFLNAAIEIDAAVGIPVICDCDTGFGNSNNVIRLVERYEAAGLAAICIEDKLFPKVNSFIPGRQDLAPVSEFVGKIMAAKTSQRREDFVVIARVEALIAAQGQTEALRRAEAYAQAGADAILIHSKQDTPDEILAFLSSWDRRAPVVVVPTTYPSLTADEWAAAGAKVVIYANHGLRAAIAGMSDVFAEIRRAGSTATVEGRIAPLKRVFDLQGMNALRENERRYQPSSARVVALIPAGGDLSLPEDLRSIVGTETPRALLDIYGKPIIERQADVLDAAGVREIVLVADIEPERVGRLDLRLVRHSGSGLLSSIRAGLRAIDRTVDRVLICFSDILFNAEVADQLLRSEDPIAILVSRSFQERDRTAKKSLDLVVSASKALNRRGLDADDRHPVHRIGKSISPAEAHFEAIGLLSLTTEGLWAFLDCCERHGRSDAGPFGEAKSFEQASLMDLLQVLVDEGQKVTALEQERGWLEIHDFEDYRAAVEEYGGS